MKNLKIYQKAMMLMMAGTITVSSTGYHHAAIEASVDKKIEKGIDQDKLNDINPETFVADGIKQEKKKETKKVYYLKEEAAIKSIPFAEATSIKTIKPYQKAKILEDHDTWKLVKVGKNTGYIQSEKLKQLKGKYIEVGISDQELKMYNKKGKVILKTKVVTGIPTDPDRRTVLGDYKIYFMQKDRVLRGANGSYETPVKYWMAFYNAYGIHDAYWRSEFGGEIYKTSGSHGCVNLPKEVAPKVYGKVKVGTPVLVHE